MVEAYVPQKRKKLKKEDKEILKVFLKYLDQFFIFFNQMS